MTASPHTIRRVETSDMLRLVEMRIAFLESQLAWGMSSQPRDIRGYVERSVASVLTSRFAFVYVAECHAPSRWLAGYALGTIKILPNEFEVTSVGYIQELFVEPGQRHRQLGTDLFHALKQSFISSGATALELQVLVANTEAVLFWRHHGFQKRALLMDLQLSDGIPRNQSSLADPDSQGGFTL